MTLAPLLARIGWTPTELGRRTGYSPSYVHDMAAGRRPTHPDLLAWLERVAAAIEAHPPPARRPHYTVAA